MADIRYEQYWWGDHIIGTKEQLQALGLGEKRAFPGEAGGPKRTLNVLDPRGFKTKIGLLYPADESGRFVAQVSFPDRAVYQEDERSTPFLGVSLRQAVCFNDYTGNVASLVAAGICGAEHFPGLPGMRKHRVTIFPDGTVPTGAVTAVYPQRNAPGAKWIEKARGDTFRVRVRVSEEEADRRRSADRRRQLEWERGMNALPRPAPLMDLSIRNFPVRSPSQSLHPVRHLKLVWSAPHQVPALT